MKLFEGEGGGGGASPYCSAWCLLGALDSSSRGKASMHTCLQVRGADDGGRGSVLS